jgi:hypothetical protein
MSEGITDDKGPQGLKGPVGEPEDNAAIVYDEAAEEKAHDELVAEVTKKLEKKQPVSSEADEAEEPAGETGEGAKEEKPSEDVKDEKPDDSAPAELSQDVQTRAEAAGIPKDLAERLHQSGQLEETIAAFDRRMIEHVQAQSEEKTEDTPKDQERREQPPPPKKDQDDVPVLDSEAYDEDVWDEDARKDLQKRDAHNQRLIDHNQRRVDVLEAQITELLNAQDAAFEQRFDTAIDDLGHESLFGKGPSVPEDKQANRETLCEAYQALCSFNGINPNACDSQWVQRALGAVFREEVFKKAQQQTVDRLRDAEGRFLPSSKPRGALPPKGATDEEIHDQLVSNVSALMKKRGVQWSGV